MRGGPTPRTRHARSARGRGRRRGRAGWRWSACSPDEPSHDPRTTDGPHPGSGWGPSRLCPGAGRCQSPTLAAVVAVAFLAVDAVFFAPVVARLVADFVAVADFFVVVEVRLA